MSHIKSKQLDLFKPPPIVTAITQTDWQEYRPISQINHGSSIEFHVPEMTYHYMDLRKTHLQIKAAVERVDGAPMHEEPIAPVNLLLSSAFSQCIVSLNQQIITSSVGCNYPYKAYMDLLTSDCSGWDFLNEPRCEGYYKDAGDFDNLTEGTALRANKEMVNNGGIWTLQGRIRMDILEQPKLILNNVSLRIKMVQSLDVFRLVRGNDTDYRLTIKDACLKVCRVKLSEEEFIKNEETLKNTISNYFFYRSDFRVHNLSKGTWSTVLDDVFHGEMPTQVTLAMVGAHRYSGDIRKSPFWFDHYGVSLVELTVDGVPTPHEGIKTNFAENDYVSGYLSLFPRKRKSLINLEDYKKGYTMFVFSIHNHITEDTAPRKTKGNVRITLHFSSALPEAVSLLIYSKFPDAVGLDSSRNVLLL